MYLRSSSQLYGAFMLTSCSTFSRTFSEVWRAFIDIPFWSTPLQTPLNHLSASRHRITGVFLFNVVREARFQNFAVRRKESFSRLSEGG